MNLDQFECSQLQIITYPNPILRYTAKPLKRVDAKLREIATRMFELMYEHRGVGLAAPQVGLPIRLFVMNSAGKKDEGEEHVIINPVITRPRSSEVDQEGCLSIPNVHGNVARAKTVRINAFDLKGNEINQDVTGYEARIFQHETDHLDGKLFIDRLAEGSMGAIMEELDTLVTDFQSRQRVAEIPPDQELLANLATWESRYC